MNANYTQTQPSVNESPELFQTPVQLSPRLAWYAGHNIRVIPGKRGNLEAVGSFNGIAINAHGETEDEAIARLALKAKSPLWFEESFASRNREGINA